MNNYKKEFKTIIGRILELKKIYHNKVGEKGKLYCGICPKCKLLNFICRCIH